MTVLGGSHRILYVPNERGKFRQVGFRRPLADLKLAGLVDDVAAFSLLWRSNESGLWDGRHADRLVDVVKEFQPTVILMQHLARTNITQAHFERIRESCNADIIYHEADPYGRWQHRLPPEARAAARAADVVFTVGSGLFRENFQRAGARDVRWSSHVFEPDRYAKFPLSKERKRAADVVIVANRNTPRTPFRGLPDWRARIHFVELMQRRFGSRLAIYGRGWDGSSAMGPVDFDSQDLAVASGWVSANWDHFATVPLYYSNRLPISLASGSIHATTYHTGVEGVFRQTPFLHFGDSSAAIADWVEEFLDKTSISDRLELGQAARQYAFERFRQDDQVVEMLNFARTTIDPGDARNAWNLKTPPLSDI